MRYTVTGWKEHQLHSESVTSARHGVNVVESFRDTGFTILLVLNNTYQELTVAELRAFADLEHAHLERDQPGSTTQAFESLKAADRIGIAD